MNDLDISCLPKDLPEFIEVDLTTLELGHPIKVSGLKLKDGITAITHGKDPVVATAVVPKAIVETEEVAATAEGEAAAPAEGAAAAPAADAKAPEAKGGDKKEDKKDDRKK
jgi:large subunit ribosomal protein L25